MLDWDVLVHLQLLHLPYPLLWEDQEVLQCPNLHPHHFLSHHHPGDPAKNTLRDHENAYTL